MIKRSPEEKALQKELHSEPQQCVACKRIIEDFSIHRLIRGSQGGKYVRDNVAILCTLDDKMLHGSPKQFKDRYGEDLYYKLFPSLQSKREYKKKLEAIG